MPEPISQAIADIKQLDLQSFNESQTRQFVIDRLLTSLGWNLFSPQEVQPDYKVGNDIVGYALYPGTPDAVFVQTKRPGANLENNFRRLLICCAQQDVNLGILTNGRSWWLFLPRYDGPPENGGLTWMEKRFAEVDIVGQRPRDVQNAFLDFLDKDKVTSGEAVALGQSRIDEREKKATADKGIIEAWNNIVSSPDDELIELLTKKTNEVCGVNPSLPSVKKFFQQQGSKIKASSAPPAPASSLSVARSGGNRVSWAFGAESAESKNWRSALTEFCELILDRHPQDFERVLDVKGNKYSYFSRSESDLKGPKPIGDSGYFVATNHGPNQMIKICNKVAMRFGYPHDSFSAWSK
jgi:hypothetical protein